MKAVSDIRQQRRKESRGEKTRDEILQQAVHVASAEGLEGLTIGRLADELNLSKSGLFAHFGSKEELQLAVIGKARDVFVREVVEPALAAERGIPRLVALLDQWLSYMGRSVFRGGCFFMASAIEFDSRPGEVRNLIAELSKSWLEALETEVEHARAIGQLDPGANPPQMAFELHAMAHEANWAYQLFQDFRVFERARAGIGNRLRNAVTPAGLKALASSSPKRRSGRGTARTSGAKASQRRTARPRKAKRVTR